MTEELIVESRQILPVTLERVGNFELWMRADPTAQRWDREVTEPILEADEYELEPLRQGSHSMGWILDVGAHIGSFTLKVKHFWPEARVIAVEPDPDSAALLRRNVESLPGVDILEAALIGGDQTTVRFRQAGRFNVDRNAAASEAVEVTATEARPSRRATSLVAAEDVVDLLRRKGEPTLDLLKLDCEGAEGGILEALASAGYLPKVGWIRGEWHGFDTIPRIEAALRDTHIFNVHREEAPWGAFIAHRRADL